ncbi:MAG: hypothetical protein Tp1123DCM257201_50 [Prokaryotic dsDNA virus sp.]|nr:MAG: hypothetical protein Tp1123DCM257201_50 [Prokaryotic dsDNA virus sp.]
MSLDTKEEYMERIGHYLEQLAVAGIICQVTFWTLYVLALYAGVI